MSMDSTFDIKEESRNLSLDISQDTRIRKSNQSPSPINNKESFTSLIFQENNKTNNSELAKLNISSKQLLQKDGNDILKNFNNPQKEGENTTINSNNNIIISPKGTFKKNLRKNKTINTFSSFQRIP